MMEPGSMEMDVALRIVDAAATVRMAQARPVCFRVAESAAEREEVYRLRHQLLVAEGWLRAEDQPDGRDHDAYDERSVQITAWEGPAFAGVARVILPVPGQPLYSEQAYGLTLEPRGRVVEASRLFVAPAFRDGQVRIFAGLVGMVWLVGRQAGYDALCGTVTAATHRLYRRLGLEFVQVAPALEHLSQWRYPFLVDVVGSAARVQARWPEWCAPAVAGREPLASRSGPATLGVPASSSAVPGYAPAPGARLWGAGE